MMAMLTMFKKCGGGERKERGWVDQSFFLIVCMRDKAAAEVSQELNKRY